MQMRADGFSGYKDLKLVDVPKPTVSDGRALIRITAAGMMPLELTILSGGYAQAKAPLATGGSLTTLGYSAGRKSTIDVTDLIWKRASIKSFSLFAQPAEAWSAAWSVIFPLLRSGAVKPIAARRFHWPKRLTLCVTSLRAAPSGE